MIDYPPGCIAAPPGHVRAGYLAWHADAERRAEAGERQAWCLTCERYRWPDTPCNEPVGFHLATVETWPGDFLLALIAFHYSCGRDGYAVMRRKLLEDATNGEGHAWEYFRR